ncbi:MAG TPA: hypothetical protein VG937_10385 [Polyangiaceae bacterium]|nr:hypothetical protein [Polyangiaceae bacterium]
MSVVWLSTVVCHESRGEPWRHKTALFPDQQLPCELSRRTSTDAPTLGVPEQLQRILHDDRASAIQVPFDPQHETAPDFIDHMEATGHAQPTYGKTGVAGLDPGQDLPCEIHGARTGRATRGVRYERKRREQPLRQYRTRRVPHSGQERGGEGEVIRSTEASERLDAALRVSERNAQELCGLDGSNPVASQTPLCFDRALKDLLIPRCKQHIVDHGCHEPRGLEGGAGLDGACGRQSLSLDEVS